MPFFHIKVGYTVISSRMKHKPLADTTRDGTKLEKIIIMCFMILPTFLVMVYVQLICRTHREVNILGHSKYNRKNNNWSRRPASELEFPVSTNFGASGLAEDTYKTSNTVIHWICHLGYLIEQAVKLEKHTGETVISFGK